MRILGVVLFACAAAVAQDAAAPVRFVADLDAVMRGMLAPGGPAALSIAVTSRDPATGREWSWSAGHGPVDAPGTRPATSPAVFRTGAVGTMVTAAAFLALVEQGRLGRDAAGATWDPVRAAAAVARVHGTSFEEAARAIVFEPLGLRTIGFDDRTELRSYTVPGLVRGWDGALVADPGHRLAGGVHLNLRASADDLARFGASWFVQASRPLLRPATRELPLGCKVAQFEGRMRWGMGGFVQGAATELAVLPREGMAVAVAAAGDGAEETACLLVDRALHAALAVQVGRPIDPYVAPRPVGVRAARRLAGRYRAGDAWFDLRERGGELILEPGAGVATRLRWRGRQLVGHDASEARWTELQPMDDKTMRHRAMDWVREPLVVPPECPPDLKPFLGEYGDQHAPLVVYEDGGRLGVLLERRLRSLPVRERGDRFRLEGEGHDGHVLEFERDGTAAVVAVTLEGTRLARRPEPPMRKFRITPLQPVATVREAIRDATPPAQPQGLRASELVDLRDLDPTLRFDVRYATEDNFLGAPVYDVACAMLQRPAAEALLAVQRSLAPHGLGLCVFDGYRPWRVTKLFWEATPPELREFVADPAAGSRHNRGCAVDLSLCDLATGALVDMPSDFDEFTWRAYPAYPGGTARQRWYRELLRTAMEPHQFAVIDTEWWHFDFHLWREYPVLDEPLQ